MSFDKYTHTPMLSSCNQDTEYLLLSRKFPHTPLPSLPPLAETLFLLPLHLLAFPVFKLLKNVIIWCILLVSDFLCLTTIFEIYPCSYIDRIMLNTN